MAKIIGNTTATPTPASDWLQTDENKADYIKNKPEIIELAQDLSVSGKAADAKVVGDTLASFKDTYIGDDTVSNQINTAISQKSQVQIITWEADD